MLVLWFWCAMITVLKIGLVSMVKVFVLMGGLDHIVLNPYVQITALMN